MEEEPLKKISDDYVNYVESFKTKLYKVHLEALKRYVIYLEPRKDAKNLFFNMSGKRIYRYNLAREVLEEREEKRKNIQ